MIKFILAAVFIIAACQPTSSHKKPGGDGEVSPRKVRLAFEASWPDATSEDGYQLQIAVNEEGEYGFPVSKGSSRVSGQVPVDGAGEGTLLLARLFSPASDVVAEVTLLYQASSALTASDTLLIPLRLKPVAADAPAPAPVVARLRDVGFALTLQFLEPDATVPAISYTDIKPLIDQHCVRCHLPVARGGGIDLSTFPFVHALRAETQRELAERVLSRMRDPRYPMPPGEPRPEEEISHIQQWVDQGLEGDLNGGQTPNPDAVAKALRVSYRAKELQGASSVLTAVVPSSQEPVALLIPGLLSGAVYELRFEFLNGSGAVVGTLYRDVEVPADGPAALALSCNCYQ